MDLTQRRFFRSNLWPGGRVSSLTLTTKGVIAAFEESGKWQIGVATATEWASFPVQLPQTVTGLATTRDGQIYIGTHQGLCRINQNEIGFQLTENPPDVIGKVIEKRKEAPVSFCNLVQSIAIQRTQNGPILWIGTPRGLFRFDTTSDHWKRIEPQSLVDVRVVLVDRMRDALWITTYGQGVSNLGLDGSLRTETELEDPAMALEISHDRSLWIAQLQGIYRLTPKTMGIPPALTLEISADCLPSGSLVRVLRHTRSGKCLIGTSRGLFIYDTAKRELKQAAGLLGNADIKCLLFTSENLNERIWVGTDQGLFPEPFAQQAVAPFLKGHAISALVSDDPARKVWIGTDQGLCKVESNGGFKLDGPQTIYNSGISSNRVTALVLDVNQQGQRSLWIGTPCGLNCHTY